MSEDAPSAWKLEQVMSIAQSARNRMAQDGTLPTDEAALFEALDNGEDVETILRAVLRAAIEANANAEAAKSRAADLDIRLKRFQARETAWRSAAFAMMDTLGLTKFPDPEFMVSIRPGSESVVITDEDALPDDCVTTKRTANKSVLADKLNQGKVIAGAELRNGMPVLQIKVK